MISVGLQVISDCRQLSRQTLGRSLLLTMLDCRQLRPQTLRRSLLLAMSDCCQLRLQMCRLFRIFWQGFEMSLLITDLPPLTTFLL